MIATLAGTALIATALVGGATAATAAPAGAGPLGQTSFEPGRYIVTLVDDAVATYSGGVAGFAPTQPDDGDQLNARRAPVQSYSDYLVDTQEEVAASAGVDIDVSYTMALNGFSAELTTEQAASLVGNRAVAAITPDELKKITATPSTEFLGLEGDDGVWAAIGGAENAGRGVVVGILDTGIAPENPAVAGAPLGTSAGSEPYLSGDNVISYTRGDGGTFTGTCEEGEQFTIDDCSTKLIGARYFVDGFGVDNLGDTTTGPGEYVSPRDGDGHGSHTATTAAGNLDTPTTVAGIDFGTFSGVAPAAKIAAYKVCWSGPDPTVSSDDGCTTTDILAAINQAVIDGVDVLNYSIGGGAARTTYSPTDDAFLGAAAAGVFVAASAGNSGPDASTLDNASPWITTVAASTIPSYEATVTLGDGQAFAGASITLDLDAEADPVEGALAWAPEFAAAGEIGLKANLCGPGTLDESLVPEETIIVCERGEFDRVAKSAEVARVGGIGLVMVNVVPGSIDIDTHSVPTVHLDAMYRDPVVAYAQTEGATASLAAGNSTDYSPPSPQVAGFSSRGPVLADGSDILKPDIAAPGVSILASGPNAEGGEPTYAFLSGTSMASPHIAGLAALYLGVNPTATPAEIKSAMMTTAYDTLDGEGAAVTDPFTQGAGHVDPTRYFDSGLLYLNGIDDWLAYLQGIGYDAGVDPVDASDLNLASIAVGELTAPQTVTRTVTATEAGTFTASVQGLAGIEATVEPSTFSIEAGQEQSFTVTFTRTDAALNAFATGSLTWTSGDTTVRSPIAVQPVTIVAPLDVTGTGTTGSTEIEVTPGATGDIPLATTGLTAGTLQPDATGTGTDHSGSGSTGDYGEYLVSVPEGTVLARFDLDTADDTADLDLTVYLLNAAGTPVAGWQSATGSADERVDLFEPTAGDYLVYVDVYSSSGTTWDLVTTSVAPSGAPLALEPPVLAGVQGVPLTFTASWADLEPETTYVGLVSYGDTGRSTVLQVETGEAPDPEPEPEPEAPVNLVAPTISGQDSAGRATVGRVLTASPGEWDTADLTFAYQWQADGVDIPGATSARYTVRTADEGSALTVVVTASAAGIPSGTATSEAVTVVFASATKLSLSRQVFFSWQRTTARVTVDTAQDAAATGQVTLVINGREHATRLTLGPDGTVSYELPKLSAGIYLVSARYGGSEITAPSQSSTKIVWVVL